MSESKPAFRRFRMSPFALVLLGGMVVRALIACQPVNWLVRTGFFGDDAFYCLSIARHIAMGRGATHDGMHITSGYQPLYVWLLVPLFHAAHCDRFLAVHFAALLLALFSTATGVILYDLLRRLASPAAGIAGLFLWCFSSLVLRQTMNGMETGVSSFFVALLLWVYVVVVWQRKGAPSAWSCAVAGLVGGVAGLARIDSLIFVAVIGIWEVWRQTRRGGTWTRSMLWAAAMGVIAFLVCLPWLAYNQRIFGTPIPESGSATRYISMQFARTEGSTAFRESAKEAVATLLHTRQLHFVGLALRRGGRKVSIFLIAVVLLLALPPLLETKRLGIAMRTFLSRAESLMPLFLFCMAAVAAYVTYVYGWWFYPRYFFPVTLLSSLVWALLYAAVVDETVHPRKPQLARVMTVVAIGIYLLQLAAGGRYFISSREHFDDYLRMARWINTHTAPASRIGCFQSGIVGYFANRTVIGLDGVVNSTAAAALIKHNVTGYMRREKLDFVIDQKGVIDTLWWHNDRTTADRAGVTFVGQLGDNVEIYAMMPHALWESPSAFTAQATSVRQSRQPKMCQALTMRFSTRRPTGRQLKVVCPA